MQWACLLTRSVPSSDKANDTPPDILRPPHLSTPEMNSYSHCVFHKQCKADEILICAHCLSALNDPIWKIDCFQPLCHPHPPSLSRSLLSLSLISLSVLNARSCAKTDPNSWSPGWSWLESEDQRRDRWSATSPLFTHSRRSSPHARRHQSSPFHVAHELIRVCGAQKSRHRVNTRTEEFRGPGRQDLAYGMLTIRQNTLIGFNWKSIMSSKTPTFLPSFLPSALLAFPRPDCIKSERMAPVIFEGDST